MLQVSRRVKIRMKMVGRWRGPTPTNFHGLTCILKFTQLECMQFVLRVRNRVKISMERMRRWLITFNQLLCRRWLLKSEAFSRVSY